MTALEIVLLIIGAACTVVSFIFEGKDEENEKKENLSEAKLTEQQEEMLREQAEAILHEKMQEISERTEAQLDKISNTKILEMNDFAETVINEISRNHNETVFLYDMLNEKAKEVKSTVKDVNIAKREVAKLQADAGNEAVQEQPPEEQDKAASGSRDLAKERLIEMVRQSNERMREPEKQYNQAVELNGMVVAQQAEIADGQAGQETKQPEANEQNIQNIRNGQNEKNDKNEKKSENNSVRNNGRHSSKKKRKQTSSENKAVFDKPDSSGKNNNEKILALYRQGMESKDIARKLGLGIGEVNLVIGLFNDSM